MADAAPKLVSMKRSAKDKRKDMGEPSGIEAVAPDYPWGLCLNLQADELEKLGIKDLPKVGEEMTVTAKVKVTRVSQSASASPRGESEHRNVELQVTDLGIT